jgi:NRPS condensation-like uncharacterized protein
MKLMRPEAEGAVYLSAQPITLNFALCARVIGPLTLRQLETALAGLGKRHPLLAVRAVGPQGSAYFTDEDVPPIPLRVVDRVNDDDWIGESERDIQRKSSYLTQPMLRCVWIRGGEISDLVLVCDHLVADGKSAIYALRDLLALLADPSMAIEPILVPPMPELLTPDVVERVTAEFAKPQPEPPAFDPNARIPEPAGPVCITPFALDATETRSLVERCKDEGVTVQAAICAAFLTPFAERQPETPVRHAEIPVDVRSRLSQPVGDSYGNMIGLAVISFDCAPGRNLWDVARDASAALRAMPDEVVFGTVQVQLALFGRARSRPWEISYDLSVSNLGRVDIPAQYGNLRLESIYAPIFPATGSEHRILGVSTFGGQMRFTFSSRGPKAAKLAGRGLELLRSMLY